MREIKDNQEYVESRQKELEEIKKVSGQISNISKALTIEVKRQDECLGGIEDNVIMTKDNAIRAEKEITDAERISRRSSRKIFWLFIILCLLSVSIIMIVIFIFLPADDKKKFLI